MVVLVVGLKTDVVIRFFAQFLKGMRLKKPVIFIDQSEFGQGVDLDRGGWVIEGVGRVWHQDVTGVWNRLLSHEEEAYGSATKKDMHIFCRFLMNSIYPCVLNRPENGLSNFSKPYQLRITEAGCLKKPESELTMEVAKKPKEVGRWVIKSICGVRSIVKSESEYRSQEMVGCEPVLRQERIVGDNIRVHVVGRDCFALRCYSQEVDYRYDKNVVKKMCILPERVKQACRRISQQLCLPFAGIDLIEKAGEYWLLEANPSPGYSYYERTDFAISNALLKYWGLR